MKRAIHNLSNYKLATCNMGQLIPIGLTEVVRGDSIKQRTKILARVQPLLAPIYHPVHTKVHHWFVPHRLVWANWEKFITGGPDGEDASVHPTITINDAAVGSLADYFGIPTLVASNRAVSALPFRGYSLIWNKFYRDQDLQTNLVVSTADGVDSTTNTTLQDAAWQKDYFTTCRSEPQKGPDVIIPIGDAAPVVRTEAGSPAQIRRASNNALYAVNPLRSDASGNLTDSTDTNDVYLDPNGSLEADLSSSTGISITDLRLSAAMQRFKEARSRFGSEYQDAVYNHVINMPKKPLYENK